MYLSPTSSGKHLRHSSRMPAFGRFLEADPLGYEDSPNLYNYVLGDPVNLVDPLGLCGANEVLVQIPGTGSSRPVDPKDPSGPQVVTANWHYCFWLPHTEGPRAEPGQFPKERGDRSEGPVERIADKFVCAITTFSGSADIAAGFGPVLKGSVGIDYNQKTGQVSLQGSYSVGYGVAASIGLGGSMSNTERAGGYSKSTNFALDLLLGLTASWSSPKTVTVSPNAGKLGFEASRTENKTFVKKLYKADKGAKCPAGK